MKKNTKKELLDVLHGRKENKIINKKETRELLKKFGKSFKNLGELERIRKFPRRLDPHNRLNPTWRIKQVLTWIYSKENQINYPGELFTVGETCKLTGMHYNTLERYRRLNSNKIKPFKIGRRIFYPKKEIQRFLIHNRMNDNKTFQIARKIKFLQTHKFN